MLIPVEWLREFVETPEDAAELADRLTVTGNEIEEIGDSPIGPVLSLKLTPNRADMLAIRGAGREVAALYERPFKDLQVNLQASGPAETAARVDVEAPELCPRYVARVIRGVKPGPSPRWMQERLAAAGLRAINTVVDVTNYVMLELGQPLHAFDLDLLEESRIVVRRARPGEVLTAIDGTELTLEPEMLVIADARRAVALAGVMGGRETEVSDGTTRILLESAYFDPVSVRRTSKRTNLSSPSSYRFERGVDPNGTARAADRAAALIAELAGGTVSETVVDVYPVPIAPRVIPFRPERCRSLLGVEISDAEAERSLARLGMQVVRESPDLWQVTAPTNRPDLGIEEDLIEEAGRLYGYDRLPETLPGGVSGAGRLSAPERLQRKTRELLIGQGLSEAVASTLLSGTALREMGLEASPIWPGEGASPVALRNALSEEFDTLRPSLIPGLIQACQHNLRHGSRDVYLFEGGYAHSRIDAGAPQDRLMIAGLMLGSRWGGSWNAPKDGQVDFYAARGTVELLVRGLGSAELSAAPAAHPSFHPGRTARLSLDSERMGFLGELHPDLAARLDLPRGVFVFELDAEALLRVMMTERQYSAPSRFPRALRDIAAVVDRTVASGEIERILWEELGEHALAVRLFDVYQGRPLPEEKVSLAYALEMGSSERTLTDEEVDGRIESARRRLAAEVGASFRG